MRRLEVAQATGVEARSRAKAAEADLRKAQEAAGEAGDANAQLRSARSAVEKAELDLARTKVGAPARGTVTDLRTDVGHFAQAGAPAMTLIANHDLWISADMTENNQYGSLCIPIHSDPLPSVGENESGPPWRTPKIGNQPFELRLVYFRVNDSFVTESAQISISCLI